MKKLFLEACKNGDRNKVKEASVLIPERYWKIGLYHAAVNGNVEAIDYIFNARQMLLEDEYVEQALCNAVTNKQFVAFKYLYFRFPELVENSIDQIVVYGNEEMMRFMLEKKPTSVRIAMRHISRIGPVLDVCLEYAKTQNLMQTNEFANYVGCVPDRVLLRLLEAGFKAGEREFHYAMTFGKLRTARALLDRGRVIPTQGHAFEDTYPIIYSCRDKELAFSALGCLALRHYREMNALQKTMTQHLPLSGDIVKCLFDILYKC